MEITIFLSHVHGQLPLRRRHGLVQRRVAPTRKPARGSGAEGLDRCPDAGEEFGYRFGSGCWRVEAVVPGRYAVYPVYAPEKCGDPVLELESSDSEFHRSG